MSNTKTDDKQFYRIGVDLGGTNIKVGIVNNENEIIASHAMPTDAQRSWELIVKDIAKTIELALKNADISLDDCIGIGLGSPGTVDSEKGIVVYAANFYNFENVPIGKELEKIFSKPVKMSNDANCAALGEFVAGAAKEYESVVLVTLGTGVGTGFVFNNAIFESGGPGGAEGGHMIIVENGELCSCGNKGCLEAYASASSLIRDAKKAATANPNSLLAQLYKENNNKMNGIIPFKAARANDEVGLNVVNSYIKHLATGLANFVNVLRPQVILISGGISNEKEYLTDKLDEYVSKYAFAGQRLNIPQIKTATLGNNAGIVGAAALWS